MFTLASHSFTFHVVNIILLKATTSIVHISGNFYPFINQWEQISYGFLFNISQASAMLQASKYTQSCDCITVFMTNVLSSIKFF